MSLAIPLKVMTSNTWEEEGRKDDNCSVLVSEPGWWISFSALILPPSCKQMFPLHQLFSQVLPGSGIHWHNLNWSTRKCSIYLKMTTSNLLLSSLYGWYVCLMEQGIEPAGLSEVYRSCQLGFFFFWEELLAGGKSISLCVNGIPCWPFHKGTQDNLRVEM